MVLASHQQAMRLSIEGVGFPEAAVVREWFLVMLVFPETTFGHWGDVCLGPQGQDVTVSCVQNLGYCYLPLAGGHCYLPQVEGRCYPPQVGGRCYPPQVEGHCYSPQAGGHCSLPVDFHSVAEVQQSRWYLGSQETLEGEGLV